MATKRFFLRRFVEAGLQFLTVIFGVLAAFWLSSWGESRQQKRLETFYLGELSRSLSLDERQLGEVIHEQETRRDTLATFLLRIPDAKPEDKASIDALFASSRGNRTFFPAIGAYRAMVAEGSLHLISNKELVTSLAELYEYYYTRAIYLGTVLDGEMEKSNWERRRFFSMYQNEFRDLSAIKSAELRSIEEHRHAYIGVYVAHARRTLEKVEEVKTLLDEELRRQD